MATQWENLDGSSASEEEWEDVDTSVIGKAKQFGKDFLGAGAALGEMAASLPAMVGAGAAALGDIPDVIKGKKRMTDVIDQTMEVGTEHSMLPFGKTKVAKNPGYKRTHEVFSMPAEGYAQMAELAGDEPLADTVRENFNQALYGSMMVGGAKPNLAKPGSAEAYRQTTKERPDPNSEARKSYSTEVPKQAAWEDLPADLFGIDQPSPIPPGVRSKYNLTPEQMRAGTEDVRMEAELAGRRGQKQGDLFLTPDEAQAQRFTTTPDIDVRNPTKETEVPVAGLAADRPGSPGINPWLTTDPTILEGTNPARPGEGPTTVQPGFPLGRKGIPKTESEFRLRDVIEQYGELSKAPDEIREAMGFNPALAHNLTAGAESSRRGIEIVQETSSNPWYRTLARRLLQDETYNPRHETRDTLPGGDPAGKYNPYAYKVLTKQALAGSEKIFMHEQVHASTHSVIQGVLDGHKQFSWAQPVVRRLNALYQSFRTESALRDKQIARKAGFTGPDAIKHAMNNPDAWTKQYGLHDIHEFIAEGFTSAEFQAKLRDTPLPKEFRDSFFKNYWNAFMASVAKLFHFERQDANYLSELIKIGSDIIDGASPKDRQFYAEQNLVTLALKKARWTPETGVGASMNHTIKSVAKGPMDAMREASRDFKLDRRPIEEVIKQDIEGRQLSDFTGKENNMLKQVMTRLGSVVKENLLQDTALKVLMKDKSGTGALIKWTVDQVSRVERDALLRVREAMDHAVTPLRKAVRSPGGKMEMVEAWKTWKEHIGDRDLSRADFRSERQFQMYAKFQDVMSDILTRINEKRATAGLKAIDRIPSYFHSLWHGDYAVTVVDGLGEKKAVHRFQTEMGANKMARAYEKAHPDMKVEVGHVQKSKYGLSDLSAFEEAIRVLSKDDPATQALLKTYREVLGKRGFGRTAAHRKGVSGFLGDAEGFLGLKDMERSFEQYVSQANRYISNLEKQKVLQDLQKVPLESRKALPETFDFLYSYIKKSQGAKLGDFAIDRLLGQLTKAVGLGETAPIRGIHQLASIASVYWLTTPRFWISQTVQSINALPKLIQEHGQIDGMKMFYDGWKNTVSPDSTAKEAASWAESRGYLDATIKNLLGRDFNDLPIGNRYEAFKEVTTYPAAKIEHQLVRLPVFLMFEKALREKVKDKTERFSEAAEKMDHYMVNYGRTHSPMIFDKTGMLGEAARPLKQYSSNYFGQFIEYAAGAKNRGELAPLAYFFGTQAAVGGLKGMLFVAEATAAVTAINYLFGTDVPTPEQLLLKSGLHDALVFGGFSTVLGADVSSSSAAPSLPSMFSLPAIDFTHKVVTDMGTYLLKKAKGTDTDQDRLRAALAVSPNLMHEFWRNVWTPEGEPTANQNDPQLRGNYRRSDGERVWATFIGSKPIDEARADTMMRVTKQLLKRDYDRKMDALDAISDRIQHGQEVNPKLVEDYIKQGGDITTLGKNIAGRMKDRMMTGEERMQDSKSMTPQQRHKIETLHQFLDEQKPGPQSSQESGLRKVADGEAPVSGKPRYMDQNIRSGEPKFKEIDRFRGPAMDDSQYMDQDTTRVPARLRQPPPSRIIKDKPKQTVRIRA